MEKREAIRARNRNTVLLSYQLAVLLQTVDRRRWTADLGETSPNILTLPTIDIGTAHSDMMSPALTGLLSSISASTSLFEVAKRAGNDDACWRVLGHIQKACNSARQVIAAGLEGEYKSERAVTGEMHATRNQIGKWRRERRDALMTRLGSPTVPERNDTSSGAANE